eukprot:g6343.t1
MVTENARLRSLLVTYTFKSHDSFGIRAIVPRAVPLNPPFSPSVFFYQTQVPSTVEDLEFCAPHRDDTQVEITGNTGLQFGINTVKLEVTNLITRESVNYIVKVDRKRDRGFLVKIATIGTIASAVIISAVVVSHRTQQTRKPRTDKRERGRHLRSKFGFFWDEITRPFC